MKDEGRRLETGARRRASFNRVGVIVAAIVGMALRAAVGPWKIYHPDSGLYMQLARRIAGGSLYVPIGGEKGLYQPLFSSAAALLGIFTGDLETAGCLLSILASGAVIVIAGAIGRAAFSERAGLITALIVAFHPGLVHFGGLALTESLYTALFAGAILVGIKALEKNRWRLWFTSGVLLGLAYLTRVVGLFELPVLMLWAYLSNRGKKGAWKMPILAAVGCMILAGPYIGYLRYGLGNWYLTGQQRLTYYKSMSRNDRAVINGQLNADGDRFAARAQAERLSGFKVIFTRLDYLARRSVGNMKTFYTRDLPKLLQPLFMMLIALGIMAAARERRLKSFGTVYLLSWWVTAIPLQMATSTDYRYYIPFVPVMAALGAGGIEYVEDKLSYKIKPGLALKIVTAVLIVTFLATIRYGPDPDAQWVNIQRRAGSWIKENHDGNDGKVTVLTREPYVAFFAGGDQVKIPAEPLPVVLRYAKRYGVNFMVIDNLLVANYHPQLAPLLNPNGAPRPWKLVHTEREGERIIYVYKRGES